MYAIAWRHNDKCPWVLLEAVYYSADSAIAKVKQHRAYDMAKRQYKLVPLRDEKLWGDV